MKKADKLFWSVFQNSPVHIAKRDDLVWWKGWIIRIISVILALVVCGVITVALTKLNPIKMCSWYKASCVEFIPEYCNTFVYFFGSNSCI